MTPPRTTLPELAAAYDAFLIDQFGVLLDGAAAQVGVQDSRGIDQLSGLLELARMEVRQRQAVSGFKPCGRARRYFRRAHALNVDRELVGFQSCVCVCDITQESVGRVWRGSRPASERLTSPPLIAQEKASAGHADLELAPLLGGPGRLVSV